MIKQLAAFLIFLIIITIESYGQGTYCGFDSMHLQSMQAAKELKKWKIMESKLYHFAQNRSLQGAKSFPALLTIPVVVHVIHTNGPENISDAQVQAGIQFMNESFSNTGLYASSTGTDCQISFCLAQRDPQGNATTGIEHIQSSLTDFTMETEDASLKALSHWDPLNYLNIYVVHEINSAAFGLGVAGYAYFPSSHGNSEDGIVGEYTFFGTTAGANAVYSHEAGHYLGLYHTFEGGCANSNCLANGDRVCDTPPDQSTAFIPCGNTLNSCSSDADDNSLNNPFRSVALGGIGDQPDLVKDFMDYGNIGCMNLFTQGQTDRMRDALQVVRGSLLQSLGCLSPCSTPVSASFSSSATNVFIGTTVNFTNTSTGNNLTYEWMVNGNPVSTNQNYSQAFNAKGTFVISLKITNGTLACFDIATDTLYVSCSVQSTFLASDTMINPGDSIFFTSTTTGALSYQWLINGLVVSTSSSFALAFNNLGGYSIQLVATGSTCSDTSNILFVQVGQHAANEVAWWYFGDDAGMHFLPGGPVPDPNNAMNYTQEGTSVVSDQDGNLLFYSDGFFVFNRNHQVMPNGSGLAGGALTSATQAALIVKKPGSSTVYYLFTVDEEGGSNGLQYSIVDITADNGMGDVTVKNVLLSTPMTEKLTATKHCNGVDIWILTHSLNNNSFYSWLLTPSGVSSTPVISSIGPVYQNNGADSRGYLRINHTGTKAVACILGQSRFDIFDFNNVTGVFANQVAGPNNKFLCYGAEFSPDNSKLYITAGVSTVITRYLYQYDMLAGNGPAIIASEQIISSVPSFGAIALAPDGKIYITNDAFSNNDYLEVVNNPNAVATSVNYVQQGFYLGGKNGSLGLPNFMSNYSFQSSFQITGPLTACANSPVQFLIHFPVNYPYTFNWITNQGGTVQIVNDSMAIITFSQAGSYSVIVSPFNNCNYEADTLSILVTSLFVNLGADTITCNQVPVVLSPSGTFTSYAWQNGSTLSTYTATQTGTYWVEVTDSMGCKLKDSIEVLQWNVPDLDLGSDTALCSSTLIELHAQAGFSQYTWQNGFTLPDFTVYSAGTYWVTVRDTCGNTQTDTIIAALLPGPLVNLGNDTTICDLTSLTLHAGNNYISYGWSDLSQDSLLTVSQPGTYSVYVLDDKGCSGSDSVTISFSEAPALDLGNDTLICDTTAILLHAGSGNQTYLWQDQSNDSLFTVNEPGIYFVQVFNAGGCAASDTILISTKTCGVVSDPNHFWIYPNPNPGNPVLDILQDSPIGVVEVLVFDMLGQLVFKKEYDVSSNQWNEVLPLRSLAQAVYQLDVKTNKDRKSFKLMMAK